MKKYTGIILAFMFSLGMFAQITPQQALEQMGRGINMGNTLEAPEEGSWAPAAQEYFFEDYKAAGYSTVRIPVRWYTHTEESAPYKISESWMNRVETIVDWALNQGFFVIINAHHSEPVKEDYEGQKERWDSIWSQVAVRFKDKPDKLFFELMNEPNGWTVDNVNEYNHRVLGIVRKTNPTRIVVLAGNNWSSANDMVNPDVIFPDDPYLFGTWHSYDPWEFGGQGKGTWGTAADKNAIASLFTKVHTWSDQTGIPVLLGEFGSTYVNDDGGDSDLNSRFRHYACFVENAIKSKVAFTVWDDNGWFQVYMRQTRKWKEWNDIILHYSPQSVTDFTAEMQADSSVLLSWVNQAKTYDSLTVQRKLAGGNYITIGSVVPGVNRFTDSTLTDGRDYFFRIMTHQSDTAVSWGYPQIVKAVAPVIRAPFNAAPLSIPGTIQAEEFDKGNEDDAYHDSDPENQGGAFRSNTGVDIEARTDGGFQVSYVEPDEWLEYTVNIDKTTDYVITAHVASAEDGGTFRMVFERGKARIWTVPATGDWQQNTEVTQDKLRLPEGQQVMRIEIIEGAFNIDKFEFRDANALALNNNKGNHFQLYPNPTSGSISVTSPGFRFNRIEIIGADGRRVYREFLPVPVSEKLKITPPLSAGIYIVQIGQNDRMLSGILEVKK
ncbi:cellulase family glycosylhydrolase [Saccharicrinis sp. FJH62]|uniref:cellulase family glycosylhydrolase n=1 Tax=Saccharicrinis sp. FJH62 TaxID=3344657 RepID=UPI0035D45D01